MRSILIGYGEVGQGIAEALGDNLDAIYDCGDERYCKKPEGIFDILVIAFGFSDEFIDQVKHYQKIYKVSATIIFSTVPIGTSRALGAYHSPVEGKHPRLGKSIKEMARWVGGYGKNDQANYCVTTFLAGAGFMIKMLDKPEATEFLKLQSTSKYGVNIEFARYAKSVCDDLGIDFKLVKDFDIEYNRLYQLLGMPEFQRYILNAPDGPIGGHCVVPNAKILDKQYPSNLLKEVYNGGGK